MIVALRKGMPGTRTRIRTAGAVACALALAATLPACSTGQSSESVSVEATTTMAASPTVDEVAALVGTWVASGSGYWTLDPDGTWYSTPKVYFEDGSWAVAGDKIDPPAWGTYTFDGSTLAFDNADEAFCGGAQGSYAVSFIDADTVTLERIEEECIGRSDIVTAKPLERTEELSSEG